MTHPKNGSRKRSNQSDSPSSANSSIPKNKPNPILPTTAITTAVSLESNKQGILQNWIKELEGNPHFATESDGQKQNLVSNANTFLSQILNTLDTTHIPDIPPKTLDPLFKLWHTTLQEQSQKGLSTKDTALMIFSLKSSLLGFTKKDTNKTSPPEFNKLGHLLDLLGLLTFEVYAAEKDRLISRQSKQIQYLQHHQWEGVSKLIGTSPKITEILKAVGLVLENDITVLLQGESGTGKDLIASIIHQNSKRKKGPFITINCGAIPKELIESELFGHEKGAFTGADRQKLGKFELAHQGTLFLDEIGELPRDMQVKLLGVLQNHEIQRLGGTEITAIDTRIIAATNANLKKQTESGTFRQDLYYRLHVYPLTIPPLRDRKEDIVPIAEHFLTHYCKQFGTPPKTLSLDAQIYLQNQHWEGNVRELENIIQRAVILAPTNIITSTVLQLEPGKTDHPLLEPPKDPSINKDFSSQILTLAEVEKHAISAAIQTTKGNLKKAAEALQISRTTLYNKMKSLEIPKPRST